MSAGQAATTGAAARPVLQLPTAVIQLGCASSACCIADGLCLPLDFLKTRMQLQNELVASGAPRLGVFSMAARVLRTEGVLTFFDGLPAAMMRQASYGGLCFASYPALRDKLNPHSDGKHAPLASKLAAGALAGGTASALANPTDVVKVRIQADGRLRLLGEPARYSGTAQAFRAILAQVRWRGMGCGGVGGEWRRPRGTRPDPPPPPRWRLQEGLAAFWKGVGPNMQRAAVVNGAGIATYDQCKQTVTRLMGEDDSLRARCLAALMGARPPAAVAPSHSAPAHSRQPARPPAHSPVARPAERAARWRRRRRHRPGRLPVRCRQDPADEPARGQAAVPLRLGLLRLHRAGGGGARPLEGAPPRVLAAGEPPQSLPRAAPLAPCPWPRPRRPPPPRAGALQPPQLPRPRAAHANLPRTHHHVRRGKAACSRPLARPHAQSSASTLGAPGAPLATRHKIFAAVAAKLDLFSAHLASWTQIAEHAVQEREIAINTKQMCSMLVE